MGQGVKSRDSTRAMLQEVEILPTLVYFNPLGYCFGLILELCCAMFMAWDGFISNLKGCFRSEFGLKIFIYGSFQKAPATLGHAITLIGAIVWLLVYSNFRRPYLSCPNTYSQVLRFYENIFESRI